MEEIPIYHPWDDCIFAYMNGEYIYMVNVGNIPVPWILSDMTQ